MSRVSLIAVFISAAFLAGCGDKAKETTKSENTTTANHIEHAKKVITRKANKTKNKAEEIIKETKQKAEKIAVDTKKKADKLIEAAKEKITDTTDSVRKEVAKTIAPAIDPAKGKSLYTKCAGCHGTNGDKKALGKSEIIAGQDAATLTASLKAYRSGNKNVSGMGSLMKGQIAGYSDSDIESVSAYISTLK